MLFCVSWPSDPAASRFKTWRVWLTPLKSPLKVCMKQWRMDSRRSDWVHGFQHGIVKVSVADVRVEHQVKLADFMQWLEKPGAKSPREMIQRQKLRSILGMPTP
jgi:hypothetical protein